MCVQISIHLRKQRDTSTQHMTACLVTQAFTSGIALPHLNDESVSQGTREQPTALLQVPTSVLLNDNRFLPPQPVPSSPPYQQDGHICNNIHIQEINFPS